MSIFSLVDSAQDLATFLEIVAKVKTLWNSVTFNDDIDLKELSELYFQIAQLFEMSAYLNQKISWVFLTRMTFKLF